MNIKKLSTKFLSYVSIGLSAFLISLIFQSVLLDTAMVILATMYGETIVQLLCVKFEEVKNKTKTEDSIIEE